MTTEAHNTRNGLQAKHYAIRNTSYYAKQTQSNPISLPFSQPLEHTFVWLKMWFITHKSRLLTLFAARPIIFLTFGKRCGIF